MSFTGCLIFESADNGGISDIVAGIEELYNMWSSKISRADFWALAANAAIIEATPGGEQILTSCLPLHWCVRQAIHTSMTSGLSVELQHQYWFASVLCELM